MTTERRRLLAIICVLLVIFAGAMFYGIYSVENHPLREDLESSMSYYITSMDNISSGDPPVAFCLLHGFNSALSSFGVSATSTWIVAAAFFFALGAITIYLLVKQLTKSAITGLAASFFITFSSVTVLLVTFGYCKQSLAISLTPLSVLFFWRGIETKRNMNFILAGIFLGVVGLTHEIAFGSLVITYLAYAGFMLGHRRRIPWEEIKACAVVLVPALLITGGFYLQEGGAIMTVGGEGNVYYGWFYGTHFSTPLTNYSDPLLFALAIVGVGITLHRRRPADFFILSWILSAFILTRPWAGFVDRFEIQMVLPLAILAAMTLSYLVDLGRAITGKSWRTAKNKTSRIIRFDALILIIFILFIVVELVTIINFSGTLSTRPPPVINPNFDPILLPISTIGIALDGLSAALLKFAVGVPLTVALWVFVSKVVYQKLKGKGGEKLESA